MKEWTRQDLDIYLNTFSEEQKDNVFNAIMAADLLQKAFNTTEGKLILNGFVEMIRDEVMRIINLSVNKSNSAKLILEKIQQAAITIDIAHKMLEQYATILAKGDEHNAKVKLLKR